MTIAEYQKIAGRSQLKHDSFAEMNSSMKLDDYMNDSIMMSGM